MKRDIVKLAKVGVETSKECRQPHYPGVQVPHLKTVLRGTALSSRIVACEDETHDLISCGFWYPKEGNPTMSHFQIAVLQLAQEC